MKMDLHVHSTFSPDGQVKPREILKRARHVGLGGICISDHNSLQGSMDSLAMAKEFGLVVIRGTEVSTSQGHMLAYGIGEPIKKGRAPARAVEKIHALGGLAAVAHPFRGVSGVGKRVACEIGPDAIEIINSHSSVSQNNRASELCAKLNASRIGGSDAHELTGIGKAYTVFEEPVASEEEALEAIRKRKVDAGGAGASMKEILYIKCDTFAYWLKRGLTRI
jgi:predicted metal-dependent phosphoesterase TrpH